MLSADLDGAQVGVLLNALDFYSRIWIGQYREAEWQMRFIASDLKAVEDTQLLREEKWLQMRSLVLPGLRNMGLSGSYGIWSQEACDRAQSAYDMRQIIRHAWAWHCHPEGGIAISFDEPWVRGLLPAVDCVCSGEGEDTRCSIHLIPAHAKLVTEALQVTKLLVRGRIPELMEHYTHDEEALAIAAWFATGTTPKCRLLLEHARVGASLRREGRRNVHQRITWRHKGRRPLLPCA